MRAEGRYVSMGLVFRLVDLPGTYSLLANSVEEQAARDFLCFGRPDATVVVVDATCLERNLNLALQVLEITPHVVVCVNLVDEARRKKIFIDVESLAEELGVPVVATSARNGYGLDKLVSMVADVAARRFKTAPCVVKYDREVEDAVLRIEPHIRKLVGSGLNSRWLALRLLDGDRTVIAAVEKWLSKSLAAGKGNINTVIREEVLA
jgi:Fe2+ transport system protein B